MIIKKPYGFYKRHYKIIHFLLLIPMLYLMLKFGDIAKLFKEFIRHGFKTQEVNLIENYITNLTMISLYFMIFAESIIFWLEKSKDKFKLLYLVAAIYYLISIVGIIIFHGAMDQIDAGTINNTYVIFVRDFADVLKYPPIVLMVWTIISGIGFNIKTMSFERNYAEMYSDEDEEEIELKLGADTYKSKKQVVHFLREAKYYVLENMFVFKALGMLLLAITIINLYLNLAVYNRKYTVNQGIAINNMALTLKDSYLTNVDMSGNPIQEGYYYLAVKIALTNNSTESIVLDKNNFRIKVDGDTIYPNYSLSGLFTDIGKPYLGNSIRGITRADDGQPIYHGGDYVFVYELTEKQVKGQYQMKILNSYGKNKKNKMVATYKTLNIKPKNIVSKAKTENISIGKEIALTDTTLGATKYKLNSLEFSQAYTFSYKSCKTEDNCTTLSRTVSPKMGKRLVIIKDSINYDQNSSYYINTAKTFYNDFGTIKLKMYNGKVYEYKMDLVETPGLIEDNENEHTSVFEVTDIVAYASDPELVIKIRNKEINIKIE